MLASCVSCAAASCNKHCQRTHCAAPVLSCRQVARQREAADREELLARAEMGRQIKDAMDEEAAVMGHVTRSRRMMSEMFEQGGSILANMSQNRERIKVGFEGSRAARTHSCCWALAAATTAAAGGYSLAETVAAGSRCNTADTAPMNIRAATHVDDGLHCLWLPAVFHGPAGMSAAGAEEDA